jgi:hypothetical protein
MRRHSGLGPDVGEVGKFHESTSRLTSVIERRILIPRRARPKLAAKNLPPAYFAMVMDTGIVSIAALMCGMQFLTVVQFAVNLVAPHGVSA